MKAKKIICMLLSLILAFGFFTATVFANEPEAPEEAAKFRLAGYYDDGYSDVVDYVKINGTEIFDGDSGADGIEVTPGETLTVEIKLIDGYKLYSMDGVMLFWYAENSNSDDYGDDFWELGTESSTSINVLPEEYLEDYDTLYLIFCSTVDMSSFFKRIDSVSITAPKINAGDGYAYDEDADDYLPLPAVTVPEDADYEIDWWYGGETYEERHDDIYWLVPDENAPLGFNTPSEDAVFEDGEWYYIGLYIRPKCECEEHLSKDAPDYQMPYFGAEEENYPEVKVTNGEFVLAYVSSYYIDTGNTDDLPTDDEGNVIDPSAGLYVVIKVTPNYSPAPPTGEQSPMPWVWAIIISMALMITIVSYDYKWVRKEN